MVLNSYIIFDKYYMRYDEWYHVRENIRVSENLCVRILAPFNHILDIGVGTAALLEGIKGVITGIDPAEKPLLIASRRGVLTINSFGEELPFIDESFDTILLIVTICFLEDPLKVLREAHRVLRRNGYLITCFIPRESIWAKHYIFLKNSGRSVFYKYARFYSIDELHQLLYEAGFYVKEYCSTLFYDPLKPPVIEYPVKSLDPDAGFICVKAEKK